MSLQALYPLPAARHLPGRNGRPVEGPVLAAASAAGATGPEDWVGNAAYLYGFDLVAAGFFWEAHEVWEPVWRSCRPNSRERALLQGLIQSANAGLKLAMNRPEAGRRLIALAVGCFEAAAAGSARCGPVMGVAPAAAADALRGLEARVDAPSDPASVAAALARSHALCLL